MKRWRNLPSRPAQRGRALPSSAASFVVEPFASRRTTPREARARCRYAPGVLSGEAGAQHLEGRGGIERAAAESTRPVRAVELARRVDQRLLQDGGADARRAPVALRMAAQCRDDTGCDAAGRRGAAVADGRVEGFAEPARRRQVGLAAL